jgi:hypothetical protein
MPLVFAIPEPAAPSPDAGTHADEYEGATETTPTVDPNDR